MLTSVIQTTFGELGARLQAFAPNLLAMVLLLAAGLLAAGAARHGLRFALRRVGFDRFAERSGLRAVATHGGLARPLSDLTSLCVACVVLIAFVLLAVAALDVRVAVELVARAFAWLPHLLVGLLLLVAGSLVAAFVRRSVLIAAVNAGLASARLAAAAAQGAVLALFGAVALEQLGLGTSVVLVAFAILFGGLVLALALAFGLAGRDLAREALVGLLRARRPADEDGVRHV
jgi:hypothetical protein